MVEGSVHQLYTAQLLSSLMVEGGVYQLYSTQLLSLLMVEGGVYQLYSAQLLSSLMVEGWCTSIIFRTTTVFTHGRTVVYVKYIPQSYCLHSW